MRTFLSSTKILLSFTVAETIVALGEAEQEGLFSGGVGSAEVPPEVCAWTLFWVSFIQHRLSYFQVFPAQAAQIPPPQAV